MKLKLTHLSSGIALAPALIFLAVILAADVARAGPPYLTDDPDPVAYHHWELYLASQWDQIAPEGSEGSLPHVEINFGLLHFAMIHLLVPAAIAVPSCGDASYGLGDMEVGANIRIVKERPGLPQIGTFPIAVMPTGSKADGLGSGTLQLFVPIWLMKDVGPWTFDGGGGVRFASGGDDAELGSFVQRSLGKVITVGAEIFETVPFDGSEPRTQLNIAFIADFSDVYHFLFSAGPSFGAVGGGQAYAAWLVTL